MNNQLGVNGGGDGVAIGLCESLYGLIEAGEEGQFACISNPLV
jgi:hypothetical protein